MMKKKKMKKKEEEEEEEEEKKKNREEEEEEEEEEEKLKTDAFQISQTATAVPSFASRTSEKRMRGRRFPT